MAMHPGLLGIILGYVCCLGIISSVTFPRFYIFFLKKVLLLIVALKSGGMGLINSPLYFQPLPWC